jgi:hypothetical protein
MEMDPNAHLFMSADTNVGMKINGLTGWTWTWRWWEHVVTVTVMVTVTVAVAVIPTPQPPVVKVKVITTSQIADMDMEMRTSQLQLLLKHFEEGVSVLSRETRRRRMSLSSSWTSAASRPRI